MEPNQNNQNVEPVSNSDVVFRDKPKINKGVIVGMVCLALLAVGGISFGVWAMMDGNAKVTKKNEQIAELNSKLTEEKQSVSDEVAMEDDGTSDVIKTADYIYVGEWGLKIKIPENLKLISYDYIRNSNGPAVVVVGANYNDKTWPEGLIEHFGIQGLGSVQRYNKGAEIAPTSPPSFVFSDDDYDYYYHSPQELYQATSEEEIERQNNVVKLVKEMFTTSSNYSKIK